MIKISVIIPVYNVEAYLAKCIDSVLNQTLKEIEIVILNDGSTDNSEEIIKGYLSKDNRIKYYCHKNIGLGPTRNLGIKHSQGEYLAFVDSDDFISEDMLECLYNMAIQESADVVCGEVYRYKDNKEKNLRQSLNNIKTYLLEDDSKDLFYREYYFGNKYSHNACDKIYNAGIVKDNNIIFEDNKKIYSEDNFFQIQLLQKVSKISFISKGKYYYRIRSNSISESYKFNLIERHLRMIKDLKKNGVCKGEIDQEAVDLLAFEVIIMHALNVVGSKKKFSEFTCGMKEIANDKVFIESIKCIRKNGSARLQPNRAKRVFIKIISSLILCNCTSIASCLVYAKYKF